jgi:hypothetical protein
MAYIRTVLVCALAVVVATAAGCRTTGLDRGNDPPPLFGRAPEPDPALVARSLPDTLIMVVNGGDPFHLAGSDQLVRKLQAAGYPQTRFAEWHQVQAIEDSLREVQRVSPQTRLVLIGYSLGAYRVRDLANEFLRDGIPVAMVAYVGADYLSDDPEAQLAGVPRVVNVTGDGHLLTGRNLFFNGTEVTGARNLRLAGTRHFDLLQHPDTFTVLVEELERPGRSASP